MKLQLAVLILTVAAESGFSQSGPATVDIYLNSRDDSGRLLAPGTTLASAIFKKIGVRLNWHKGEMRPAPNAIAIRTLEQAPESATPGALAGSDPSRVEIAIYKNRLESLLEGHRTLVSVTVGYVLAHELAHVMQGVGRHSESGILKAHWSDLDFHNMVFHKLFFTETDVELIHKGPLLQRNREISGPAASATNSSPVVPNSPGGRYTR